MFEIMNITNLDVWSAYNSSWIPFSLVSLSSKATCVHCIQIMSMSRVF